MASDGYISGAVLILAVGFLSASVAASLDSFGAFTTGEIELENPVLTAALGEKLELNRKNFKEKNISISGQEMINFNSRKLPPGLVNGSKLEMKAYASVSGENSETLELRLRYTNETGTYLICSRETLVRPGPPQRHVQTCEAGLYAQENVKYLYELIGAPNTTYNVHLDGYTGVEVDRE